MSFTTDVHSWTIETVGQRLEKVRTLQWSACFPEGSDQKIKWRLAFYPVGKRDESYCSLYLNMLTETESIDALFEICLMDYAGQIIIKHVDQQRFTTDANSWGWEKLVKSNYLLEKTRLGDKLLIVCTIRSLIDTAGAAESDGNASGSPSHQLLNSSEDLMASMSILLREQKYSDVTLSVGGRRFKAHRGILASRSSTFGSMFEQKPQSNCYTIGDVEPAIFEELLRYIYLDRVDKMDFQMAWDLYAAADRYKVPPLKRLCQQWIRSNVKAESEGTAQS